MKLVLKRLAVLAVLLSLLACVRHADAISARRLVEVADIGAPTVSPDGSSVAFRVEQASIERNLHDTVWYVQSMTEASLPLRVAGGGIPLRDTAGISLQAAAVWSPDGRWIYYRALMDGRIDVWRAATDGSGAEPITLDPADVRDFSLSADGKMLKYAVGATREEVILAEQTEYDSGIHIDKTVPIGQGLFRSGYIEGRLATQRLIENEVERVPMLANVPDRWKELDLVSRAKRDVVSGVISQPAPTAYDLAEGRLEPWKLAHDQSSGRIALLVRFGDQDGLRDKPNAELAVLPSRKSRRLVKCTVDLCTGKAITGLQWRPASDEVLFTVTDPDEGYAQSIFRWNVGTGAVYPVIHARGLVGGGGRYEPGDCAVSSVALACVAADADRPPRLERIDLESGHRHVLFDPNAAIAWDMARSTPARLVRWTDSKGESFTGQFFAARSTGNVPPPLFVTYYRCLGFVRGGFGDEWPLATLAAHGISALCINAAPVRLDATERYDQGRSAVESVVDLLASAGEIDRTKVGMGGLSFGTEVTMWTVMYSDVLAAASVASLGISPNYYLLLSNYGEAFFPRLRMGWQLGSFDETPERWKKISPVFNLEKIRSPILMQLPEQEYIHSLDYAIPLMRDRKAELYVFPHEPHQKFQPRHKLAVYERNLDWFLFWLKDIEDTDPAKSEQYLRWRLMKTGTAVEPSRDWGRSNR